MCHMTLSKHAHFHEDETISGAIKVKNASKHNISIVNDHKLH